MTPPQGWAHLDLKRKEKKRSKKKKKKSKKLNSVEGWAVTEFYSFPTESLYRAFSCTPTISTSLSEETMLIWPLC